MHRGWRRARWARVAETASNSPRWPVSPPTGGDPSSGSRRASSARRPGPSAASSSRIVGDSRRAQGADPGTEWQHLLRGVAVAEEDGGPAPRGAGQDLRHEPALADPGFAHDGHDRAPARAGRLQHPVQARHLGTATHERRIGARRVGDGRRARWPARRPRPAAAPTAGAGSPGRAAWSPSPARRQARVPGRPRRPGTAGAPMPRRPRSAYSRISVRCTGSCSGSSARRPSAVRVASSVAPLRRWCVSRRAEASSARSRRRSRSAISHSSKGGSVTARPARRSP